MIRTALETINGLANIYAQLYILVGFFFMYKYDSKRPYFLYKEAYKDVSGLLFIICLFIMLFLKKSWYE